MTADVEHLASITGRPGLVPRRRVGVTVLDMAERRQVWEIR
jgi:hypothetical protein